MKKILFVCDGDNFPAGAFEFIRLLRQQEPVWVKGFFFNPIDFQQLVSISYMPVSEPYVKLKEKEKRVVSASCDQFVELCQTNNIKYHVDEKAWEWDRESFVRETRFADLVVLGDQLFCSGMLQEQPNYFMQEALHAAECPVMIIPEKFSSFDRMVVAYDGKRESVFALKQFCYLFPKFTDLPTEFVFVRDESTNEVPDADLLKEYSCLHFNSLNVSKLHFDAKKHFSAWMAEKKNALLMSGSFSRSMLSNTIRKSFSDTVLRDLKIPVFIAHHP
jgi:hypothetical protein